MTAHTVASRKSKGRLLQNLIVQKIREYFPKLTENDVKSTPMGMNASDVWLSEEALRCFPFEVEAKNCETFQVWKTLKQCEDRAEKNGRIPLVVFKRNRTKPYCIIDLNVFMTIMKAANRE